MTRTIQRILSAACAVLTLCHAGPAAQAARTVLRDERLGLVLRVPHGWQAAWSMERLDDAETVLTAVCEDAAQDALLTVAEEEEAFFSAAMLSEAEQAQYLASVREAYERMQGEETPASDAWISPHAQTPFFCILLEDGLPEGMKGLLLCMTVQGGRQYTLAVRSYAADAQALRGQAQAWMDGLTFDPNPEPGWGDWIRLWLLRPQVRLAASALVFAAWLAVFAGLWNRARRRRGESAGGLPPDAER